MIGFLMIPQFSMIAFSAAIKSLRLATYLSGQELHRWQRVARRRKRQGGPIPRC
jgi:transcriptional regulator GlxA family with amidase domain